METGDTKTLEMKSLLIDLGLVDIWRLKNPTTKRFTYRQRRPLVQSHVDYFMISSSLNEVVDNAKIFTSFCSDHSCVALKLNPLPVESRCAGYWKFSASLTNDAEYINQLNRLLDLWMAEYDYTGDRRVVFDLLNMKFVGSPVNTVLRKRRTIRKNSICTGDWKI